MPALSSNSLQTKRRLDQEGEMNYNNAQSKETKTQDSDPLTEEQLEFLSWCERKGYFI